MAGMDMNIVMMAFTWTFMVVAMLAQNLSRWLHFQHYLDGFRYSNDSSFYFDKYFEPVFER
jgi:hypothetical protein